MIDECEQMAAWLDEIEGLWPTQRAKPDDGSWCVLPALQPQADTRYEPAEHFEGVVKGNHMKLKPILFLLAALLLLSPDAKAAWLSNAAGDFITIADNAALTLPDGDWTLFGRFRQKSNAGTGNNYILGWGRQATVGGAVIRCLESSEAGNPDDIQATVHDGTTTITVTSTGNECATTTWQNFVVTHTGGSPTAATITLYVNGSSVGTPGTNNDLNAIDPIGACIGRHFVTSACSATGSNEDAEFTDFGMWTRALSAAEITTLQKFSANCLLRNKVVYIPGIREFHELASSLILTPTSIDVVAGPPIIYCH